MSRFRRRPPPPDVDPFQALYDEAWLAYEGGRQEEGIALLREALVQRPDGALWFDLGLMHKWRREWAESLAANLQAVRLDPDNDAASWNGAIAATALHDWPAARRLWAGYGVELPDETGEPQTSLGPTPVRVDLGGTPEVVWCDRLDPARARIENVPTPDCARRWHDVVLHDGVPNGERRLGDDWVPVFDEISLWRPAELPKLRVEVGAAAPHDVEALVAAVREAGRGAEDWTGDVQLLCADCSEGRAEHDHAHPPMDDWAERRPVGLGCEPELAARLLDAWVAAAPDRRHRGPVEQV